MPEWIVVSVLSFLLGVGTAWFLCSSRAKLSLSKVGREHEARAAAAEARVGEMQQQILSATEELVRLRERISDADTANAVLDEKFRETENHLLEQKNLLDEAKMKLLDAFRSLAAEALAINNTGFLALAEEKFKALKESVVTDLDTRKQAIDLLVQPIAQTLELYQKETRQLEDKRLQELSILGEQLRSLAIAQTTLQNETAKLVNALRSPQVRGRWGEIALRKTAELAGMSLHCDFVEQESVTAETGRLRPDMIVKLPSDREVVVDSKVPLGGFIEALEATTDQERDACLMKHANQVNQHVLKLASKEYWGQFAKAPEFVVLFIPNDSFLAAAAEKDPNLVESALAKGVVIATPSTFIALLRAIAYGWRQEQLTENANRISALGMELSDRMATLADHLIRVGTGLGKAVESYNAAVASCESRVFPSARKFKELGAGGKREIEGLVSIDQVPHVLSRPDDREIGKEVEE